MNKIEADSLEKMLLQIVEGKKPQDVNQLIFLLRKQLQVSEEQALEQIMDLETRGKIRFTSQTLQSSVNLGLYIKTKQAIWYWITTVVALLALISIFIIPENLQPLSYVRYITFALFVLFLPGYTFIKTLFPKKVPIKMSDEKLDVVERFALSVGVSLVVVPIVGLLLNYTPWGIGLVPITLTLFAFSMVFASTGLVREHRAKMKTQM